jgi:radical SAM superfamily enzyme YgiQ (UPF0313 family)
MQQTIDFAKELNIDLASFNIATPYPGTRFYNMVKEKGKFLIADWKDFDWDKFHHTSGKMIFTYPGTASPEEVAEAYKRAHKEFYFRPKYILRQLLNINSIERLKVMLRGIKALMSMKD